MASDPVFVLPDWLQREDEVLAPYAMRTRQSRGRRHPEPAHAFRTLYQRDRDRVVHSTAFRRLMHNEDLTEAIALSHALGLPPFGHAGERALDECMRGHGGFEHNRH